MVVEGSVVPLDRFKCLLVLANDEEFRKVLALDRSWWVERGIEMTLWTADLIVKPKREVWLKCLGVPFDVRCSNTFLSIGRQWGEVLSFEFGSVDCGALDDDRIKLLSDVVILFSFAFKLQVDDKLFDCWVVEERSFTKPVSHDYHDASRAFGLTTTKQ
ncbi:hypothetical protein Dimus_003673, partial [Dionaea muscipula]